MAEEKGLPWCEQNNCNDRGGGAGGSKFTIRPMHMENGSEVSSNGKGSAKVARGDGK